MRTIIAAPALTPPMTSVPDRGDGRAFADEFARPATTRARPSSARWCRRVR